MGSTDDLSSLLKADLSFIDDIPPLACELIESDPPVLTVNDYIRDHLLDDEPFLKISLTPIQMSLFTGIQAFLLKLLPNLSTRNTAGESLHHINYAKVDFTGLASTSHGDLGDAATIPNLGNFGAEVRRICEEMP